MENSVSCQVSSRGGFCVDRVNKTRSRDSGTLLRVCPHVGKAASLITTSTWHNGQIVAIAWVQGQVSQPRNAARNRRGLVGGAAKDVRRVARHSFDLLPGTLPSLLGCLCEHRKLQRHDVLWSCGHGMHPRTALQSRGATRINASPRVLEQLAHGHWQRVTPAVSAALS